MRPALQLKLSQQLTMTPQLQQAIRLLQLPVMDLNQQIQEALEENVMLELEEPVEAQPVSGESTAEVQAVTGDDSWRDVPTRGADSSFSGGDGPSMADFADTSHETLRDHLLWQLELDKFSPREYVIAEAIIDGIQDDGYLGPTLEDIQRDLAGDAAISVDEIERVLSKVQRFDPAGVGARTLDECIGLQLRQLDPDTEALTSARVLAEEHLDLMAEQNYPELRRRLQVSDDELELALALVRGCHPKPGLAISSGRTEFVVPDVYVRKVDGVWQVEVSASGIPKLAVNQRYADMLRSGDTSHSALKAQLQEARWLVRSLEIRHDTVLKVARSIVERQTGFFEHGEEFMKPMVLRDVAEAVDMHESTISRVTNNKYMHTPRGVLEFKYFFSSHLSTVDGDEQSSTAVRAKIKKLIGSENPAKPLSDAKIAALLKDDGVNVARRTVAKYRESMGIPSSSDRRVRENKR
ncbi:MAG: RNA polymerase factor sigma-54 [Pseudomonadota bacterium]